MALPTFLLRQLSFPSGWFGPFTAWFLNRGNRQMNRRAVRALQVEPGHGVLDLGFGGGAALPFLLDAVPEGTVTAIDPSADMVARARRRFRRSIRDHRLHVAQGSAEALPLPDASVHGVITVNTVYFWPDLPGGFSEIARVLVAGGRLVVAISPSDRCRTLGFDTVGFRAEEPDFYAEAMRDAGFAVAIEDHDDGTSILVASHVGHLRRTWES